MRPSSRSSRCAAFHSGSAVQSPVQLVEAVEVLAAVLRVGGQGLLCPARKRADEQLGLDRGVETVVEAQLPADQQLLEERRHPGLLGPVRLDARPCRLPGEEEAPVQQG